MDPLDDPRWDQLPHLFAGELPEPEARQLQAWIDANPGRQAIAARLHDVWKLTAEGPTAWNTDAALARVMEQGSAEPGRVIARFESRAPFAGVGQRPRGVAALVRIAAAIAVIAGAAALFPRGAIDPPQGVERAGTEYATPRGQRLSFRLPDGTLVALAPESRLRAPSTYGMRARDLFLEGEAYFIVTHDSTRPFTVRTPRAAIRDLGTRFVVRAYPDAATDVVVTEGLVAVGRADSARNGHSDTVLRERQRARLAADGTLTVTDAVPLDGYLGWTEGRLLFRKTPLREAVTQLERWYDVDIRLVDASTGDRLITASFETESVQEALRLIGASFEFDVQRLGRSYTLQPRMRPQPSNP